MIAEESTDTQQAKGLRGHAVGTEEQPSREHRANEADTDSSMGRPVDGSNPIPEGLLQ